MTNVKKETKCDDLIDTLFEMKQKLNAPGPSALMQTAGLPVSQP